MLNLKGVADPDPNMDFIKSVGEVDLFKNANDLISSKAIDAIIISSPNETHFKYLTLILEKFKGYIFCEKPPVTELAELKKLEELHQDYSASTFHLNLDVRLVHLYMLM